MGATSESTCVPCQVNTFSESSSAELCTPCTEGTFSLEGSTTCTEGTCPAGQELSSPTECSLCQPNTFSNSFTGELCSPCPTGKFSGYGAGEKSITKPPLPFTLNFDSAHLTSILHAPRFARRSRVLAGQAPLDNRVRNVLYPKCLRQLLPSQVI